jgi:hypothetical protein
MIKHNWHRWTLRETEWLIKLYQFMGDYEIALVFDEAFPKEYGWTLKHIEKRRKYSGLRRTKEQLKAIRERNRLFGCWMVGSKNAWQTRGAAPIGEVRKWKQLTHNYSYEVIKTKNGFERLARYTWQKQKGKIPAGFTVVRKDMSVSEADVNNLELIERAELAQRNKLAAYPYELRKTIITLNKLNKTINEKQNTGPTKSFV